LTGLTAVNTGATTFLRINKISVDADAVGAVTARVTNGTGTVVDAIEIGARVSKRAVYTVPANHKAFLLGYTVGTEKANDATVSLHTRALGTGEFTEEYTTPSFQSVESRELFAPRCFRAQTDIDLRTISAVAAGTVYADFEIILDER
jgi:hypothetical protein